MTPERDDWLQQTRDAARAALRACAAPSDRLAWLRMLARLEGGRLDLADENVTLSDAERASLGRFGMYPVVGTAVVRVDDDDLPDLVPGLAEGLVLDTAPRTNFQPASPDAVLLRYAGHGHYRSATQKAAVHALATLPAGGALMVSMPTGSGKSLLFQIAPRLWRTQDPGACVVVITPTVALADDHERTLRALPGLERSRALSSSMTVAARAEVLDAFRRGEVPVLLLSPEAAFGAARSALLEAARPPEEKFGLQGRLAGVFVDEAHIIESWGRTFRPDFQRLPALIDRLRAANADLRTVLLSATLTDAARDVLRQSYGQGPWLEIHAGVPRYDFDLVSATYDEPARRDDVLLQAIDRAPRPAIVYTTLVEAAADLHQRLKTRGYERMALFTGDLSDGAERKRIVQAWAAGDLDLVVATSAFGLGVDKPNVRAVLHACLPESPARYYQEIGRASRDGHQGLAVCLWTRQRPGVSQSDEEIAGDMATSAWLSRDIAEARWSALCDSAIQSWSGDERWMRLRLDAARAGLGPYTGEPNRRWNMSLLNLLQRAGVIRVEHVDAAEGDSPRWDVVLLNDGLLEGGAALAGAWDHIYQVREAERSVARAEITAFKALMGGRRPDCLLTGLFGLIEPDLGVTPPPCGRCPTCRGRGLLPPEVLPRPSQGEAWRATASSERLPPGILVVAPDDPSFETGLPGLLESLAEGGVEQVIAPDPLAAAVGAVLAERPGGLGLAHEQSSWAASPCAVADVPTALLLSEADPDPSAVLERLRQLSQVRPDQSFVLVASSGRRIDGRPLGQIASPLAAYDQTAFKALVGGDLVAP